MMRGLGLMVRYGHDRFTFDNSSRMASITAL
ncbi:hypothetical protein E9M_05633 [Moraxella catarrhalis 46P47B1]|nr:hypothetical protein E9G_06854 [Moraxella catarrhalis 7169]EGE12312.1 hypothetical protein E9M_05633 [Moraxella catarrhalis 46P47B1]EGE15476.1 hypothetical protein E9O_05131 [Moraxella catarrhalis 12P80B1]EGE26851.1 hypothetical protein EA1_05187 [Moraxella catarrhalis O35E]